MTEPLVDGHGREIGDVRISVTDRCNFRCQYCMPAEGLPWLDREDLLSYEEIARLVGLLAAMGVHDVRLTGGEPLARRELWRLVELLSADPNVHDLSLTTNGYLLERQVERLVRAGLRRVNVSLDALAPDRFFQLTRRNSLRQVLEGLAAAERYPELRPIKVNVVALRDFTEDEVVRFAEFARKHPYEVRFIEFMPLDADRAWSRDRVLENAEVRRLIHAAYPLEPLGRERHGTARRWRFADGRDRLHLAGERAVLRRLQPDPRDGRGQAADVPVLDERDRPARTAAGRCVGRGARGDRARGGVGQGAQAPRQ
jgi:cyclic pyranopterin phosphate synthase